MKSGEKLDDDFDEESIGESPSSRREERESAASDDDDKDDDKDDGATDDDADNDATDEDADNDADGKPSKFGDDEGADEAIIAATFQLGNLTAAWNCSFVDGALGQNAERCDDDGALQKRHDDLRHFSRSSLECC